MLQRFRVIPLALVTMLALLGAHEFGHILAAWLTGGSVGEVVLFSVRPHVRITGDASGAEAALRAVSGSILSVTLCLALLLVCRSAGWKQVVRDLAAMFGCVELLGWALSAITKAHSASPDDAERFLAVSGYSAAQVVAVCGAAALVGVLVFLRTETKPIRAQAEVPELRSRAAAGGAMGNS